LIRPCPDVEASDSSNFLCLDSVDNRRSVGHYFFAPPVSDFAGDTHIENREIVRICDLGVYPEIASAVTLDHFDRYVGDLKGFLTYGGLDRQAHADCCNQRTSVHCKLRRLSDRQNISVLVSSENEDDLVKHLCTILCEFRWHSW
jgi:hypothetical protein